MPNEPASYLGILHQASGIARSPAGGIVTGYRSRYNPRRVTQAGDTFMNLRAALSAALLAVALVGGPAFAHHSFSMFEMDKDVTYKGVVTEYKWINPHVHITVDIKPGPGVDPAMVGLWDIEGGSTN